MESTWEEYEEWCEEADPNTQRAYKAALEKLQHVEPFENRLVSYICVCVKFGFCYVKIHSGVLRDQIFELYVMCSWFDSLGNACLCN